MILMMMLLMMILMMMLMMLMMMMLMTYLADNLKTGAGLVILVCQGTPEPVSYSQHWNWNRDLAKDGFNLHFVQTELSEQHSNYDVNYDYQIWGAL